MQNVVDTFVNTLLIIQSTLVISNSLISINRLSRLTAYLEVKIWSLF